MCLSLKSTFWKATLSKSQFRSSGAQTKCGLIGMICRAMTPQEQPVQPWLAPSNDSGLIRWKAFSERIVGISAFPRFWGAAADYYNSRARDYNTLKYSAILLLRLPSSRLAVNFGHSRIVAAALLSSFFCHQLKRIKLRAETKTITNTNTISAPATTFWKKNTQKRSFFFFSWGWGMFILNLLIFLPLRCQTVVSVPFYSSLLTLYFSHLKNGALNNLTWNVLIWRSL